MKTETTVTISEENYAIVHLSHDYDNISIQVGDGEDSYLSLEQAEEIVNTLNSFINKVREEADKLHG